MVIVKIIENLKFQPDNWITRVVFFKSNGGCLYAQEVQYPDEYCLKEKQYTITLGETKEDIRKLRDFLNSLNLDDD